EYGRCLLCILAVNLEVAVLGEADNRLWMGFFDGIVGCLCLKGQRSRPLRNAVLRCELVDVFLNTAGFRMEACFETLTAENVVKLSCFLSQITHRRDLAVLFFQRLRLPPIAAEWQKKGGAVLKCDGHLLNRNGELLHPLHMGSIVQLDEAALYRVT